MPNVFEALPALLDRLGIRVGHVLHVGAHHGEEMPYYRQAGIQKFTLVEPQPSAAARLRQEFPDATVIEAACGAAPGQGTLAINRVGTSSSLAEPHPGDTILKTIPVKVTTVADIAPGDADMLVVDAQGLELDVLKGAGPRLAGFKVVVCETCTVADRTMASPHTQVVDFMTRSGFRVAETWERSYQIISRYVRGSTGSSTPQDRVYDVVFTSEAPSCA